MLGGKLLVIYQFMFDVLQRKKTLEFSTTITKAATFAHQKPWTCVIFCVICILWQLPDICKTLPDNCQPDKCQQMLPVPWSCTCKFIGGLSYMLWECFENCIVTWRCANITVEAKSYLQAWVARGGAEWWFRSGLFGPPCGIWTKQKHGGNTTVIERCGYSFEPIIGEEEGGSTRGSDSPFTRAKITPWGQLPWGSKSPMLLGIGAHRWCEESQAQHHPLFWCVKGGQRYGYISGYEIYSFIIFAPRWPI